ncbi:MAG TPA: histidinol dehydrogenase, partial [Actinomycetota bacterium]|nr:histidinol dehydrogenase [Actinomycetota bacterium]
MLTLVDLRGYTGDPLERLPRAAVDREAARESVRALVADVRARGDVAVREASSRFGGSAAEPRRISAADLSTGASPVGLEL